MSRYRYYGAGFVLSLLVLAVIGLVGVVEALSVLGQPRETLLLVAMAQAALPWLVAGVVVGFVATVLFVATVVSLLRDASLPESERLASLVERAEREYPVLRKVDAADRFEPTTETREQRLQQQYVDGDLSEEEFEREMDELLDEDDRERERA